MTSETGTRGRVGEGAHHPGAGPSGWARRLSRFGYRAGPRSDTRAQLVPPFPEPGIRVWQLLGLGPVRARIAARSMAWLGPLLVAVFAGVLRFWRLGQPRAVVFDETYCAKESSVDTPAFTPERKRTPAEQDKERSFALRAKDRAAGLIFKSQSR